MLCVLSAPLVWGQTRPVAGSAMDRDVSCRISQAWSEDKDASGAEAFHENGEIALSEGKEQEANGYFQAALRELAGIEARQSGGVTSAVSYQLSDGMCCKFGGGGW